MATLRQIEANRRNALNSTGPRSVEGKAVTRLNALKSGIDAESNIITGESRKDLEALIHDFYDRFHPFGIDQICLLDTVIHSEWLLRRLRKVETQLWEYGASSVWELDDDNPLGQIASNNANAFSRLQRRIDSTIRNRDRALEQLRRLRKDQPPAPQPVDAAPTSPEIGFVPSNAPREALDLPPLAPSAIGLAPDRKRLGLAPSPTLAGRAFSLTTPSGRVR